MTLFDAEILYCVLKLGAVATHPAIMRSVEIATGKTFHRQNLRRIVEGYVARGHFVEYPCRIPVVKGRNGRPSTKRFELTESGREILREYCAHSLSFAQRYGDMV